MIKFIYYIIFLVFFIFLIRERTNFIIYIPLFNLLADSSFSFFSGYSEATILRGLILILFIIFSLKHFNKNNFYLSIYLFLLYTLILVILSEELSYSLKVYFQILIPFLVFIISISYFDSIVKIQKLIESSLYILPISALFTIMGYFLGIGRALEYTLNSGDSAENVGLLGSGGLYTPAIIISLLPLISYINNNKKRLFIYYIWGFITYIFILLNMRRTAILIPIVGLIPHLIFSKYKNQILKYLLLFFTILLISFPLYKDVFIERYELRAEKGRFEKDFYKTEARYIENVEMLDEISEFHDPYKVLFGIGNNAFAEAISNGQVVRRMYHSDTAKLYHSVGLFGLFFYFSIYLILLKEILKIRNVKNNNHFKIAALGLLFIQLFVSLNGSITIITFRTVSFLFMGAFIGFAKANTKMLKHETFPVNIPHK